MINLHGGPGCGKSTLAYRIAAELKELGKKVEFAPEFAKELVWEKSFEVLNDQLFVFGTQQHRLFRLAKDVDIIVTDSPLILSLVYGEIYLPDMSQNFKNLILEEFNRYPRLDIFIERDLNRDYETIGRNEDLEKSIGIDNYIKTLFQRYEYNFDLFTTSDKESSPLIIQKIMDKINS